MYTDFSSSIHAKAEFEQLKNSLLRDNELQFVMSMISVELVDGCIRKLKLGKACGPDELFTEHLLNAHPSLRPLMFYCFAE